MSILRNLIKIQNIPKVIPANYNLKRFQSSCNDINKMKESPKRRKFKALQAKMQRDIHAPVFLIMGTRDKILFYVTVSTIGIGLLYAFKVLYMFSKRPA